MHAIGSDILIVGREQEATLFVSKHVQKNGYTYLLVGDALEATLSSSIALAIVCCSQDDTNQSREQIRVFNESGIPVLVVLNSSNQFEAEALRRSGAAEVCLMPFDAERFQDAFDTIIYKQEVKKHRSSMMHHARTLERLTPRERRIVQLAADGKPNKQIANNVGLSVKSIERIRRDAYRKLNVRSTAEMTRVFLLGSLYPDLGTAAEAAFQ